MIFAQCLILRGGRAGARGPEQDAAAGHGAAESEPRAAEPRAADLRKPGMMLWWKSVREKNGCVQGAPHPRPAPVCIVQSVSFEVII